MRPDLGRHFSEPARQEITKRCPRGCDLQIAIGDGLSVLAVSSQVPALLPLLVEGAAARGWKVGQPFVIRHCRVGILNEIGELLGPQVAVLLIGERPGLATAESLSAYMAYRPARSPHRRAPKSDLKHSRPRRPPAIGRHANPQSRRADDGSACQRLRRPGTRAVARRRDSGLTLFTLLSTPSKHEIFRGRDRRVCVN